MQCVAVEYRRAGLTGQAEAVNIRSLPAGFSRIHPADRGDRCVAALIELLGRPEVSLKHDASGADSTAMGIWTDPHDRGLTQSYVQGAAVWRILTGRNDRHTMHTCQIGTRCTIIDAYRGDVETDAAIIIHTRKEPCMDGSFELWAEGPSTRDERSPPSQRGGNRKARSGMTMHVASSHCSGNGGEVSWKSLRA